VIAPVVVDPPGPGSGVGVLVDSQPTANIAAVSINEKNFVNFIVFLVC
jgi:hypothetical protein